MKTTHSAGITFPTVMFIAFVVVMAAAMMPALTQAVNTGIAKAPNGLTAAFMAGIVPVFFFLLVAKAFASEELERRRDRGDVFG